MFDYRRSDLIRYKKYTSSFSETVTRKNLHPSDSKVASI